MTMRRLAAGSSLLAAISLGLLMAGLARGADEKAGATVVIAGDFSRIEEVLQRDPLAPGDPKRK